MTVNFTWPGYEANCNMATHRTRATICVYHSKLHCTLLYTTVYYCILLYTTFLGVSLKVVQMLQHFEHLVTPLAQAVEIFANTFGAKNVVSEVIRYIMCISYCTTMIKFFMQ